MSADFIDYCPVCHEHRMRVWRDIGLKETATGIVLEGTYRVHCHECDFKWEHALKAVRVPKQAQSWVP